MAGPLVMGLDQQLKRCRGKPNLAPKILAPGLSKCRASAQLRSPPGCSLRANGYLGMVVRVPGRMERLG